MQYKKLGSSDLQVSDICLGSMTWGNQNTETEAFSQIDYALEQGINFIDTAEMYAVPPSKETCGLTEQYIGNWLANNPQRREQVIIATKIAGSGIPWIRDGGKISGAAIKTAVDGSLKRLQTDYIDVYQLHWVNRGSPHFGTHWPGQVDHQAIDASREHDEHLEILTALDECIKQGKIKHCGLSNDTPWGIAKYLALAAQHNLPKMVSLQNEFSLLHLNDHPHIFETCALEDIAYLPWSPLAGGALSGKYRNGARPEGCRWSMLQRNGLFRDTEQSAKAVDGYFQVASDHGLNLTQMSLAWVYHFKGVTSTIIGATSMEQLKQDIEAYQLSLNDQVMADIDAVMRQYPVPF